MGSNIFTSRLVVLSLFKVQVHIIFLLFACVMFFHSRPFLLHITDPFDSQTQTQTQTQTQNSISLDSGLQGRLTQLRRLTHQPLPRIIVAEEVATTGVILEDKAKIEVEEFTGRIRSRLSRTRKSSTRRSGETYRLGARNMRDFNMWQPPYGDESAKEAW